MIEYPFLLAGMAGAAPQINKNRLIEGAIMAAVSGIVIAMVGYFVAFPVMQEQMMQVRREAHETRQLIRDIKQELESRSARRDAREAALEAKVIALQIENAKRR